MCGEPLTSANARITLMLVTVILGGCSASEDRSAEGAPTETSRSTRASDDDGLPPSASAGSPEPFTNGSQQPTPQARRERLPRPGIYRVHTSQDASGGGAGVTTGEQLRRISLGSERRGELTVVSILDYFDGDTSGGTLQRYAWTPKNIRHLNGVDCEYRPPPEILRFEGVVGDRWSVITACGRESSRRSFEVSRVESIEIGGEPQDAIVIRESEQFLRDGAVSSTLEKTSWWGSSTGLLLRAERRGSLDGRPIINGFRLASVHPDPG